MYFQAVRALVVQNSATTETSGPFDPVGYTPIDTDSVPYLQTALNTFLHTFTHSQASPCIVNSCALACGMTLAKSLQSQQLLGVQQREENLPATSIPMGPCHRDTGLNRVGPDTTPSRVKPDKREPVVWKSSMGTCQARNPSDAPTHLHTSP